MDFTEFQYKLPSAREYHPNALKFTLSSLRGVAEAISITRVVNAGFQLSRYGSC